MNIVFMGSSHYAEPSLRALIANGYKISCVVTQADKRKDRGLFLGHTVIKEAATQAHLKIFQPRNINSAESIKTLKDLSPDLFVVLAYGQILSEDILNIPRIMPINVHGSLLPLFRGAAPINWAIIKGEKLTGNTLIKITRKMDSGPIILQKEREILDSDTTASLEEKLSQDAAELLLEGLKLIETKKLRPPTKLADSGLFLTKFQWLGKFYTFLYHKKYRLMPQDDRKASFAPKLKKEDGLIDWNRPALEIYNLIKGCFNWPGAFTYYKAKLLKIYKAAPISSDMRKHSVLPGEIIKVCKEGIIVATLKGDLLIEELQIEGKRRMKTQEFILGHRVCIG